MITQEEETQAKEFLKRAEIRTMRKDLLKLREVDSLKERDKIATIKTLDEQLEEKKLTEKNAGIKKVLQRNEKQEVVAEKDLKNYATEQERQQIFLLESQKLGFEKQADEIDQKKDPELKLEKNKLLLQKRDWQAKLNTIVEQEKKLETEQKFVSEKSQTTTIPSERKGLEERRGDLEKQIQEVEKTRWQAEKQIEELEGKVSQIDKSSDALVVVKNDLRNKILGIDKSLREIYSVVIAREEERRSGMAKDQIAKREALSKVRAEEKEIVQRQQRSPAQIPVPIRKTAQSPFAVENEQRKKFLQDVEQGSQIPGAQQQKSNIK
ncbi:MAG: hypothetical protein NTV36_01540 [Candidatus Staskawiczbacteria bacterium]|nr:hypothetical protein [Candidatus Staskawiczbacteria bacterium]